MNGALADRQWATFTDDHTVLLTYNQTEPHNSVVIKSTDGGLTYSGASAMPQDADFPWDRCTGSRPCTRW